MAKKITCLSLVLLIIFSLAGCSKNESESQVEVITSLEQLNESGRKIGAPSGAKSINIIMEQLPNAEVVDYKNVGEGFIALKTGKIDGFCFDRNIMQYVVNQNPDLILLDNSLDKNDLAIGGRKSDTDLMNRVNAAIKTFNDNGLRDEMEARWLGTDLNPIMPEIEPAVNPTETLIIGVSDENRPMSYLDADGNPAGFDAEYALRLGKELNARIEFATMEWVALIPSLQSERIDLIVSNLNITEERRQALLLSDVYAETDIVMMVRNSENISENVNINSTPGVLLPEEFDGKTFAILTGTIWDKFVEENFANAKQMHFNSIAEAFLALRQGKVDASFTVAVLAEKFKIEYTDLEILFPPVFNFDAAFVFSKDNSEMRESFNNFLAEIRANGVYEDMENRWINTLDSPLKPDIISSGENGKLVFGTTGEEDVFSFIQNGSPTGFEVEIAERFAQYMSMELDIQLIDFAGLIPAVQSGKIDFAGNGIAVTEERAMAIDFSDTVYSDGIAVVVRKNIATNNSTHGELRAEDWVGKSIGVITGTVHDQVIEKYFPGAVPVYFNDVQGILMSLENGRIDGMLSDESDFQIYGDKYPGLRLLEPYFDEGSAGMLVSKDKPELLEKINAFLAQIIADGTHAEMFERWIGGDEIMPEIPEGTGEVLRLGTSGIADGFAFYKDGEIVGIDIEFARRFAAHENMRLEITVFDFSGLIPALQSGKIDYAASCFAITEERAELANYTDPYYTTARAIGVYDIAQIPAKDTFLQSVKTAIERNLIRENRWKMIVDGLYVSMLITICAFILATILGFAVCYLRMSRNRILKSLGSLYIMVLRGTPVVVLLMLTFYVIFAKSSISGVTVAIIAFGINGAAFIGEIIRSAILTVDKGQIEAARSMGFGKVGAFFTVTLPQAARVAFPVYMSEFISLFKMTAVVGYIAVVDLTKAGDIIRSRTYDAFFPLIFVALVYLAAASLMIWLFGRIDYMTNKRLRRNRRKVK
ncbi:MAG: ABC transporter permease subunit [Oscillospiraceae bacterium]|nr:ABC transporter permease subunit [Oscillospiraceae bacterium]